VPVTTSGPIHSHFYVAAAARVAAALIVSLALIVTAAAAAQAASSKLYVNRANPNCSDAGPGTQSQPFCTIGHAASVAAAGTTVIVSAATYSENVTIANSGKSGSPIVFTAAAGARVTVSGQAHGFTITSKSYVTIQASPSKPPVELGSTSPARSTSHCPITRSATRDSPLPA
jgi:hypothetical protein